MFTKVEYFITYRNGCNKFITEPFSTPEGLDFYLGTLQRKLESGDPISEIQKMKRTIQEECIDSDVAQLEMPNIGGIRFYE